MHAKDDSTEPGGQPIPSAAGVDPSGFLDELRALPSVEAQVRAALLVALPNGHATIAWVAKQLETSGRTLQRRLRVAETTFQGVLRTVRHDLAVHYLTKTDRSASEIALLLGFDEPNSFYRAFRAWTGTTPSVVRANAAMCPDAAANQQSMPA